MTDLKTNNFFVSFADILHDPSKTTDILSYSRAQHHCISVHFNMGLINSKRKNPVQQEWQLRQRASSAPGRLKLHTCHTEDTKEDNTDGDGATLSPITKDLSLHHRNK